MSSHSAAPLAGLLAGSDSVVPATMSVAGMLAHMAAVGCDALAVVDADGRCLGAVSLRQLQAAGAEAPASLSVAGHERVAAAFRRSPVAISITDAETGRFVEISDRHVETFGWRREELLGRTALEVGLWSGPGPRGDWLNSLKATGRSEGFRTVMHDCRGDPHWVSISAELVDLGGRAHALTYIQDLTARHLSDMAFKESEQRFQSLFANMWEGVALHEWIRDAAGRPVDYRIIDCNPRFEAIFGIPRSSAIGKPATEVYGAGSAPFLDDYLQVAAAGRPRRLARFHAPLRRRFAISVVPWQDGFAAIFADTAEAQEGEA